jgi:homoserine acetyltransferase
VVSVDPLGGGGSTKPSDGQPFTCSIADHAEALSRFVRERFGVSRLRAFAGASMASFIGVHWAAARPREIANLALWTPGVFSDAYSKRTLTALAVSLHAGGAGVAADVMLPHITSRAFLSGATQAQADTMRGALANSWSAWDPNDLIGRYNALKTYDPVAYFGGVDNLARKIEARALFLVCDEDQVTPAAQVRTFARRMRDVRVRRSPSPLGHLATVGQPGSAEFTFFDRETARFLRGASK